MTESSDDDLGIQPLGGVFGIAGTDDSDDDETLAEIQKRGRDEVKFGTGRQVQERGSQNHKDR